MRLFRSVPAALLMLASGCCRAPVVDRVENPTSGAKPLDLVARGSPDDAGLPLAPRWQHQWDGHGTPDPGVLCAENPLKLVFDRCTTQSPSLDVAASFANAICSLGTEQNIRGHVNWWPVTYNGNLHWNEASIDGDYTLELVPDGEAALVTSNGNSIHVEFDSTETVAYFDTPWWNGLRDRAAESDARAKELVSGQEAVLTGLFGLDCEHDCHVELHPVYVFALKVEEGSGDERWAFFARNWGNEGFCSRYEHVLPIDTVAFRLPWRCGATSVDLVDGTVVKASRGATPNPRVTWAAGEGVVVEIDLPRADPDRGVRPRVHGEFHLAWTMGQPCAVAKAAPSAGRAPRVEKEENSPERRLKQLGAAPGAGRGATPLAAAAKTRDDVPVTLGKPNVVTRLAPKAPITASARPPEAKEKLTRDERTLRAGCEAARAAGPTPPECEQVLR